MTPKASTSSTLERVRRHFDELNHEGQVAAVRKRRHKTLPQTIIGLVLHYTTVQTELDPDYKECEHHRVARGRDYTVWPITYTYAITRGARVSLFVSTTGQIIVNNPFMFKWGFQRFQLLTQRRLHGLGYEPLVRLQAHMIDAICLAEGKLARYRPTGTI